MAEKSSIVVKGAHELADALTQINRSAIGPIMRGGVSAAIKPVTKDAKRRARSVTGGAGQVLAASIKSKTKVYKDKTAIAITGTTAIRGFSMRGGVYKMNAGQRPGKVKIRYEKG